MLQTSTIKVSSQRLQDLLGKYVDCADIPHLELNMLYECSLNGAQFKAVSQGILVLLNEGKLSSLRCVQICHY